MQLYLFSIFLCYRGYKKELNVAYKSVMLIRHLENLSKMYSPLHECLNLKIALAIG